VLRGKSRALFMALDDARTLREIKTLGIASEGGIAEMLGEFEEMGIVYREGERYLGMVLHAG
jgi:hypothetical protein